MIMIEANLQAIKHYVSNVIDDEKDIDNICGFCDDVYDAIQNYINKIVEELEKAKKSVPVNRLLDDIIKDYPKELGMLIAYDKAIEIVKGGEK